MLALEEEPGCPADLRRVANVSNVLLGPEECKSDESFHHFPLKYGTASLLHTGNKIFISYPDGGYPVVLYGWRC